MTVALDALAGTNPIGFLAALGCLAAATRQAPDGEIRLSWREAIVPRAQLHGIDELDELVALLDRDRSAWASSPLLQSGPDDRPEADVKTTEAGIRLWASRARRAASIGARRDVDQFQSLLAEFALATAKPEAKPTALHFTTGQQSFLEIVRTLQSEVTAPRLAEAMVGPWNYDAKGISLRWDASTERIYALQGFDPQKSKPLGVPGVNWLAFLGLTYFPVVKNGGAGNDQLLTAGCAGTWKTGSFRWPLWSVPMTDEVVRSLLREQTWASADRVHLRERRIFRVLRAPIKRSDQGGYGSFGPAGDLATGSRGAR
jgi:hypothetical protein